MTEPDDDVDSKAFYPLLAELSPEDWEVGAAYELPESPRTVDTVSRETAG